MPTNLFEWTASIAVLAIMAVFVVMFLSLMCDKELLYVFRQIGLIKPLPYQDPKPNSDYYGAGLVFTFDTTVRPKNAHRCRNDGTPVNGSVWICTCKRGYVQRGFEQVGRQVSRERRYWWRIRPHHPILYTRYRRLLTTAGPKIRHDATMNQNRRAAA